MYPKVYFCKKIKIQVKKKSDKKKKEEIDRDSLHCLIEPD